MAKLKRKNIAANSATAKIADPQIDALLQQYAAAKTARQAWESVWQDCYDYALPHRDVFADDGAYNSIDIYDATAADAVDQLAASLLAQLAPPWSRWFALSVGMDVPDNERAVIADKLENITARIHAHLMQSNFATEIHQCLLDLVVAGTGSILVDEAQPGELSALQFHAVPLAHVTLAEDDFSRLNTTYRTQRSTMVALQQRFPQAADILAGLDADIEYPWLEIITPDNRTFQYSAILLEHPHGQQFLSQQRLSHSPFIHARWLKSPGEVYGRSPVMKALPDIKTANKVVELVLQNASIAVTGIWQADDDGVLNPATIQLKPGTIIPKAVGSAGLTPLGAPGRFDVSQLVLTDLRQQIRRALMVDQLGQMIDRNMTATEITQRGDEMSRLIGAIYGRLQAELLTPLIQRVVAILARRGEIPDIHIDGRYVSLSYQAPLAQAQKMRDAQNVLDWLKMAAGLGPEALAMIDAPATAQYLADHSACRRICYTKITFINPTQSEPTMDNLLTQDQTTTPNANGVPAKFWDANTQSIRTDALLKSYLELEKKLTRQQQLLQNQPVNNIPATHDDYCINCDHGYFQADPELNQQLHGKGFSNDQAQFVYDLAAEKLVPLVLEVAQEFEAQRELEKLQTEFGGPQGWQQIAPQINAWGKKQLPAPVFQALSSTHTGVMAMHQMMGGETNPVTAQSKPNAPDHDLNSMVKDPRYWQQKDPAYVAKVTAAFQRKYNQ